MTRGPISTRYAKALLLYATESGSAQRVFSQVCEMMRNPGAVSAGPLEPDLQRFVNLMVEKRREDCIKPVFRSFISMYCTSHGIIQARLTAVKESAELTSRLQRLLEEQTGCEVLMETSEDASLLGGFVLDVKGRRLDASVRGRLEAIRTQYVISNNRIV